MHQVPVVHLSSSKDFLNIAQDSQEPPEMQLKLKYLILLDKNSRGPRVSILRAMPSGEHQYENGEN